VPPAACPYRISIYLVMAGISRKVLGFWKRISRFYKPRASVVACIRNMSELFTINLHHLFVHILI